MISNQSLTNFSSTFDYGRHPKVLRLQRFALYFLLSTLSMLAVAQSSVTPFTFNPVIDAALTTQVISNSVAISGASPAVLISVLGGDYSVDNGVFTSTNGVVSNGQTVRVRLTTAADNNRLSVATLTVGDYTTAFKVGTSTGSQPQPIGDPLVVLVGQDALGGANYVRVLSAATMASFNFSSTGNIGGINIAQVVPVFAPWYAYFAGTGMTRLAPGEYNGSFPDHGPGEPYVFSDGLPYCSNSDNTVSKIKVTEVEYLADGSFGKLALDFVRACTHTIAYSHVFGHVRINSVVPIDYAIGLPRIFEFPSIVDAPLNSYVNSTSASITGINVSVPVTIAGGEYSINDGPFTAASGTIHDGQSIKVRLVSSATPNTLSSTTLTVGEFSTTFRVGTAAGITPQPATDPLIVSVRTPIATGPNTTEVWSPATMATIQLSRSSGSNVLDVVASRLFENNYQVWMAGPGRIQLAPGVYRNADFTAFPNALLLTSGGASCLELQSDGHSVMTVHEVEYLADGTPAKLAVDLVQHCQPGPYTSIWSYIRVNSTVTIDYSISHPAPFSFTSVSGAVLGSTVASDEVTIRGINVAVPVSITGGEYSIDDGAFTSTTGTISYGQRLRLRAIAPSQMNDATVATVLVGDVSAKFTVGSTVPLRPQPNGSPLVVLLNHVRQTGLTEQTVFSAATLADVSLGLHDEFARTNIKAEKRSPEESWGAGASGAMQSQLTVGTFQSPYGYTSVNPRFAAGSGKLVPQCSYDSPATVTVREIELSPNGETTRLALDFVHDCRPNQTLPPESVSSTIFGYVRINSDLPIDYTIRKPVQFFFPSVTGATPGSLVISNEITVQGITVPVTISITGGEFSVDGGPFVSDAGVVTAGQKVRVRVSVAAIENVLVTASLSVGEWTTDFSVGSAVGTNPQANGAPLVVLISQNTEKTGGGKTFVFSPATFAKINLTAGFGASAEISNIHVGDDSTWNFSFAGPNGSQLVPGTYLNVASLTGPATQPFFYSSRHSQYCFPPAGQFTVHEATYVAGQPTVLAVDFVMTCWASPDPLYGYVRINSAVPIVPIIDATPSPFNFPAIGNVLRNTSTTSATVTIENIAVSAPISISGGEYSIDNGPFTGTAGTITSGQTLKLRLASSPSYATSVTATVTVGGIAASFVVTTETLDTLPDYFYFSSANDAPLNQLVYSSVVTISGINATVPVTITGGEFSIDGGPFTNMPGMIAAGQTIQVRRMSASTYQTSRFLNLYVGSGGAYFFVNTLNYLDVYVTIVGNGKIISTPAGINCPDICESYFDPGTQVTLSAIPGPGVAFTGWSGGGCTGTGACVLSASAELITAKFAATVPSAPTNVTAVPGNGNAIISFSSPASSGGPAIGSYTATCNPGMFTASSQATPIVVRGLSNDTNYSCSVTATNSVGAGAPSSPVSVTPTQSAPLMLASVKSRKHHQGIGNFDLPIKTGVDIADAVTVEPRALGTGHVVIFFFNNTVSNPGAATVVDGNGNAIPVASLDAVGDELRVTLNSVPDATRIRINVTGVNGAVNAEASLGFLFGDVNGSRSINVSDVLGVKARKGQPVDSLNYLANITLSGNIDSADLTAVKARSGTLLP